MRSTMRSRSWGSFVPPTATALAPAPWPRSTMPLTLRRRPRRSGSSTMCLHPARLQVHDGRAGAHAHRPARHASRAAGARAGASE